MPSLKRTRGEFKIPGKFPTRFKMKLHEDIAEEIIDYTREKFKLEKWDGDRDPQTWPDRKKNYPWPKLRKSNKMYNSIRRRSQLTSDKVIVTPSPQLVYPPVHNEGLRAGRGSGFKMPKRQFMGKSSKLEARIKRKIKKRIDKLLKDV